MPIHRGYDQSGYYYQWGNHGHRYHFYDEKTEKKAYEKAVKQAQAAYAHGYKKKYY
jgi:hypothetical protein